MYRFRRHKTILLSGLIAGCLFLLIVPQISAQTGFNKPRRRTQNKLDVGGPHLKSIYTFEPAYYDTLPSSGPEPVLVTRYRDEVLIPLIFDAVFSQRVRVFDPNFWGSVPQFLEKSQFEESDTLEILHYLSAGWDTTFMIDNDGRMEIYPVYKPVPYEEISGIFFFESWWLDGKNHKMYKDVAAYLPIREYLATQYEGYDATEIRRRLLFMVIPEWSSGSKIPVKYRPGDFQLVGKDLQYEVKLYNKPYDKYLYREEEFGQIGQDEFNAWQYHRFDFYRYFDANLFLEKIIRAILDDKLKATPPETPDKTLGPEEFIRLLYPDYGEPGSPTGSGYPGSEPFATGSEWVPGDYLLSELNSIIFHEDWYIHPENLQIYKDVKALTVTRTESLIDQYTGDFLQENVKPLFTVWF